MEGRVKKSRLAAAPSLELEHGLRQTEYVFRYGKMAINPWFSDFDGRYWSLFKEKDGKSLSDDARSVMDSHLTTLTEAIIQHAVQHAVQPHSVQQRVTAHDLQQAVWAVVGDPLSDFAVSDGTKAADRDDAQVLYIVHKAAKGVKMDKRAMRFLSGAIGYFPIEVLEMAMDRCAGDTLTAKCVRDAIEGDEELKGLFMNPERETVLKLLQYANSEKQVEYVEGKKKKKEELKKRKHASDLGCVRRVADLLGHESKARRQVLRLAAQMEKRT